jgi:hypothetical protein
MADYRFLTTWCLDAVKDRIRDRLVQLSARLGDADWLDGRSARAI